MRPGVAVLDRGAVGEPAEGLKHQRIGFRSAELQPGRHVEAELVSAMRNLAPSRPAIRIEHRHDPKIFGQSVGQRRIDLDPIAVRPHARSEEHTSELQSLMRLSYAVFCLKKKQYK